MSQTEKLKVDCFPCFEDDVKAIEAWLEDMATKWEELWGYYVKILIALVLLLMFRSAFGIIGIIASLIVLVLFAVVSIMKYVYLYEMAKLFQGVAERKE